MDVMLFLLLMIISPPIYTLHKEYLIKYIKSNEIYGNIDETVAVLMLTHVNYRDASVLEMKAVNEYAHKYGVLTVWDLSHNIGIVPVDLEVSGADFAVGCTYKYLSGGLEAQHLYMQIENITNACKPQFKDGWGIISHFLLKKNTLLLAYESL